MTFEVEFTRRADRDLRQIADRAVRRRILARVSKLAADPRPPEATRLRGRPKDIWRIRVGDWRVCYQVRDHVLLVLIVVVGLRGDVYERLTRRLR